MRVNKFVLLSTLSCALCGCKTRYITQEVPVVVEHTTTMHHTDIMRDTLLMRDSVYHFVQGDTVRIERWHHTVKVERVMVADTVRDSVPVVVTVTETKTIQTHALHWWQKALLAAAGIIIFASLIYTLIRK